MPSTISKPKLKVSVFLNLIDLSLPFSSSFVSIDGSRRVFDVEVLNDEGIYEKLDPEKNYTISSHNYLILDKSLITWVILSLIFY